MRNERITINPVIRDSDHYGIIPESKGFLSIFLDDSWNTPSASLADVELQKKLRKLHIHGN